MFRRVLLPTFLLLFALSACSGRLDVQDLDAPSNPTEDAGSEPDSDLDGDPDTLPDTDTPECCPPTDDVQCSGDSAYIQCIDNGTGCAQWTEPTSCPADHLCNTDIVSGDPCEPQILCDEDHPDYGQPCTSGLGICENPGTYTCSPDGSSIECDATPGEPEPQQCNDEDSNCDGTVDSNGICGPCIDDQYAPNNFVIENATSLTAGSSLDLNLCDNQDPDYTSHNWFSLGQTTSIDIILEWESVQGTLGLDIWTSTGAPTDRTYYASAGSHPSELSYQTTLGSSVNVFARVFFWPDTLTPPAGTPYTISRN